LPCWADLPSIFTVGVRDPREPSRLLSVTAQPVDLGSFGGWRIALGARDLVEGPHDGGWSRLSGVLETVLTAASWHKGHRVASVAGPSA
jgi:hypothetical protein